MIPDPELGLGSGLDTFEPQADLDDSVGPVARGTHAALGHERLGPDTTKANRAPGPHGRPTRRPPLDAAEQRRAVPALVLGAEEQASPSGAGPASGEQRSQGREAEQEHVVRLEPVDAELVRNPHVLRVEQVLVVEPDVGDGGQPVEVELPRAFEGTFRRVEPAPVPPVAPVEKTLVVVPPRPLSEVPQRARRGPGNRRWRPRPVVSGGVGRVDTVLGFDSTGIPTSIRSGCREVPHPPLLVPWSHFSTRHRRVRGDSVKAARQLSRYPGQAAQRLDWEALSGRGRARCLSRPARSRRRVRA